MAPIPVTADDWLPVLTDRLDERQSRLARLRAYANGNAPLPEMGRNVRASWQRFQQKSRSNFAELIIEALAERLIPNGVTVGESTTDDNRSRRIWRENRMDIAVADTIRDMLTVSIGYMVVGKDSFGRPVVTSELPEFMYAATDPLRPWIARAAVKVWRDRDAGMDYAYVWVDGSRQKYSRSAADPKNPKLLIKVASGKWDADGAAENYTGPPPVVVFENHDGTGEFEPHTDLLDRINLGILQRLVTVSMQAFRQRAIKGDLPPTDTAGNTIDYAAVFSPAPGALWQLPGSGLDIWESQESSQSITAMLSAVKDDIRDLAAVTRTPTAMLMPEGENQAAAGAEFAKEGLVMKARDRISRITPGLNEVMGAALRVETPGFEEVVNCGFADPTHVSTSERYDAATKAQSVGIPFRTIMIDILGFSAEKVDAMEVEREVEALSTPEPTPEPVTPVASNTQ